MTLLRISVLILAFLACGPAEDGAARAASRQAVEMTCPLPLQVSIKRLGTLGGDYSSVSNHKRAINNRGQVVGTSLTARDELRPFLWDPHTRRMRNLGTLGGWSGSGDLMINEQRQVAGESVTSTFEGHAFLWQRGVMRDLGHLGGFSSSPRGLNNHGHVVGIAKAPAGTNRAFLWDGVALRNVGVLPGFASSWAEDINDQAQIIGGLGHPTDPNAFRAFFWDNGEMIDIGSLGSNWVIARAINNNGQVAGYSDNANGSPRAFRWDPTTRRMRNLGTLGGPGSFAYGINDDGQVVGMSLTAAGQSHAFLWRHGEMIDLGTLGGAWSEALLIDAHGRVAGNSQTASGDTHAFFWEQGQMIDLGTLGGFHISSYAYAMNDHGQVVGDSATGLRTRAVRWTVTCPHPEHTRTVE